MKRIAALTLFILAVDIAVAQTNTTVARGLYVVTGSGTNSVYTAQDSTLMGQRYAQRNNLLGPYTAADTLAAYNRGKASVVCPPPGYSQQYVDSVRNAALSQGIQIGLTTPPDSLVLGGTWPTKTYIPKP